MSTSRKCGTCGWKMFCLGNQQLQLGPGGFRLGNLSTPSASPLDVEVWECPACGKIDFYRKGSSENRTEGLVPQIICCKCGTRHDLNAPECPACGWKDPNYS